MDSIDLWINGLGMLDVQLVPLLAKLDEFFFPRNHGFRIELHIHSLTVNNCLNFINGFFAFERVLTSVVRILIFDSINGNEWSSFTGELDPEHGPAEHLLVLLGLSSWGLQILHQKEKNVQILLDVNAKINI